MSGAGTNGNISGNFAYSSEKHDKLYSKARFVLNQRHIKRPWFNINPFYEKTDEKTDLDNFQPEESKYVQRLESLVLCESFQQDLTLDTKEVPIDEFFDYLYSNGWSKGCSLRVMEGQLLDELLLGLHRLETNKQTVRHATYAIANNNRPRHGCYKLANKEAYGSIEETLLLEFTYYGKLTKEHPNAKTLDPFEYLPKGIEDIEIIEETPVEETDKINKTKSSAGVKAEPKGKPCETTRRVGLNLTLPTHTMQETIPRFGKSHTALRESLNAVRFISSLAHSSKETKTQRKDSGGGSSTWASNPALRLQKDIKEFLERRTDNAAGKTQLKEKNRSQTSESEEEEDDEEELVEPKLLESRSGALPSTTPEEKDNYFGEELHLSDVKRPHDKPKKSTDILKQKQAELHQRRDAAKQARELKLKMLNKPIIPPIPSIENITFIPTSYEIIRMPDEIPTFENFIKFLKEDEYYDPRYRNRIRLKGRRLAQRYYMARESARPSLRIEPLPVDIRCSGFCTRKKRLPGLNEQESGQQITATQSRFYTPFHHDEDGPPPLTPTEVRHQRHRHSLEVLGVTDSEPCKTHFYKEKDKPLSDKRNTPLSGKKSEAKHNIQIEIKTSDGRHSRKMIKSPTKLYKSCNDHADVPPSQTKSDSEQSEASSTSSSSAVDSDEDFSSAFDTNKLNIRYSFEGLKKKRKNRAVKKKPAFMSILSKYYKMHDMTSSLGRTTPTPQKTKKPKESMFSVICRAKKLKKQLIENPPKVGKLRKFKFNETSPPKKRLDLDSVNTSMFRTQNLKTFHTRLALSLGDFVVRREVVVSSLHSYFNTTTSVTFTRTSCFQQAHTH